MPSCLDEDLTLGRLAEVSGLGLSQFARAFRGATGQPPHRYLTGLRIEKDGQSARGLFTGFA